MPHKGHSAARKAHHGVNVERQVVIGTFGSGGAKPEASFSTCTAKKTGLSSQPLYAVLTQINAAE
jgi:hypothetical protein